MFNTFCLVFQLYDVLRYDSTVAVNLLVNISSPKFNQFVFISKDEVHE